MEANTMWEDARNDAHSAAHNRACLDILTNAIFNSARLNYSGEKLAFDDDELCTVLRAMYPNDYDSVLVNLQAIKAGE
jgi:hypothetical protein|nr:MAG TPA: hypothetical protein [Caudoviricetes sp.]